MGLTANDIVQLPVMETSAVKTGKGLLDGKQVEWVSVIEGPVENFVRKNEFVLSTGMGCEEHPEKLEQFVLDVIKSGASLLGIATGRYVFNIPDRIISLAAQHQFIIVEMPWEVRFGDVLQSVLQEINKEKQGQRNQAEEVRKQLISSVLHDKGLAEMTALVYRQIEMPVAVQSEGGNIRCHSCFDEAESALFESSASNQQSRFPASIGIGDDHPLYHHMELGFLKKRPCYRLAIQNNHKIQGYLLFQPEIGQPLTWFMLNVLEHALTAFALHFAKENAVEMAEIRLKDTYVLDLVKSDQPTGTQSAKAGLLGYDLSLPYTCLVGKISYKNQVDFRNDNPANSSLQSLNFNLQKEITNAGAVLNRRTMATFEDGEVIIFLEDSEELYYKAANQFLDIVERRLYAFLPILDISWGAGKHEEGIDCFKESYEEAKTALEIGRKQHGSGGRTFFEDTRINRLLMNFASDEAIVQIVSQTVSPLIAYDNKRKTDLIRTFLAYNQHKGNVSQTARSLNLHRQSLLHRLRTIESLTQLSLVDPDDLFLLELSVRLWMMQKIE